MPPSAPTEQALDPAYWRALCPHLHVEDVDFFSSRPPLTWETRALREVKRNLLREGYFQLPPLPGELHTTAMAQAVETLYQAGWMAPFCFVYDEFWLAFWRLRGLVSEVLGPQYRMLPDFWVWRVDPRAEEAGWGPHRDKGHASLFDDGAPKSLTIWIAITDATPLNGCMYMLPADRDPFYRTGHEMDFTRLPLQEVRALPGEAGTVFGWNQAVAHWGGHASRRAPAPRMSMAFEFQRGDVPPFNAPLLDPDNILALSTRLRLIAKQVLQYDHMYPLPPEMRQWASGVVEEWKAEVSGQTQTPAE